MSDTKMDDQPIKAEEEASLEELFTRLDAIIGKLEDPATPLEDAFATYKDGLRVLATCTQKVDLVEKEMIVLEASGENQ